MQKVSLELKSSTFTLFVLHIHSADITALLHELDEKLAQASQFFVNIPMLLNLKAINGIELDLAQLHAELVQRELIIIGITETNPELKKKAEALGFPIIKSGRELELPPPPPKKPKIIRQTIRSGQQVVNPHGDLIIIGAVSNGAEVIADGSIHIYGALRGKAMAGVNGNQHAVIIAQKLDAELVSIAGQYWLTDKLQQHDIENNACIRLNGDTLTIE